MINLFLAGFFLSTTISALDDGEYPWASLYGFLTTINLFAAYLLLW